MITPAQTLADATEQRDAWRSVWQVVTGDALLVVLSLALAIVGAALMLLPQAPAAGVSAPMAYSQWQATAQAQTGAAYPVLLNLGLFSVAQSFWARMAAWLLAAALSLRLIDRASRLALAQRPGDALLDENRLRVSDHAEPLSNLAERLRARRYRVATSPLESAGSGARSWLCADRWPGAEALSMAAHAGALVILVGVALNSAAGWEVSRAQVNSETSASLQNDALKIALVSADLNGNIAALYIAGGSEPLTLTTNTRALIVAWPGSVWPCCLSLQLDELTREYQVTARAAGGQAMTITLSSYATPASEALLAFRLGETERSFAVEPAGLALIVSARAEGDRVRAYTVPAGRVLTDTLIQPSLTVSGTTLSFQPRAGAIISIRYQPGLPVLLMGAVVAVLGALGTFIYPFQRLVVRQQGAWTEFYAGGRRVGLIVREISMPVSSPAHAAGLVPADHEDAPAKESGGSHGQTL